MKVYVVCVEEDYSGKETPEHVFSKKEDAETYVGLDWDDRRVMYSVNMDSVKLKNIMYSVTIYEESYCMEPTGSYASTVSIQEDKDIKEGETNTFSVPNGGIHYKCNVIASSKNEASEKAFKLVAKDRIKKTKRSIEDEIAEMKRRNRCFHCMRELPKDKE
jgi:hypothetical protein